MSLFWDQEDQDKLLVLTQKLGGNGSLLKCCERRKFVHFYIYIFSPMTLKVVQKGFNTTAYVIIKVLGLAPGSFTPTAGPVFILLLW